MGFSGAIYISILIISNTPCISDVADVAGAKLFEFSN